MKKYIFTIMLLTASIIANAAALKFYINPGHGGHDSNDRPTPLPLGVEIFYESDGTLDRGKHVASFLKQLGINYKMSRTTNTSADDLGLSTIASYSSSYGGYFMSLHSNGANASANYVIAFYKGKSSSYPTIYYPAPTMALKVAQWHDNNHLTNTTYSTPRAGDDYAWNGWHYGVLRTNTAPGYLVETWFHDYRPESLRMKQTLYNKYLAWQIVRAAKDSPGGISATLKGCVVGDIRDVTKSCGYTNYTRRGRDTYLAINGAKVTLKNSSGAVVGTCTTDYCANGFYGFFDLTAGTYTVTVEKSGYKTQTATVTVSNNASTKKTFNLVEGVNTGITLSPASHTFSEINAGTTATKAITVTGTGLSANISVSNSNTTHYSISTSSLGKTGGSVTVTYKPQSAGSHSTTLTFTSGSSKTTMVINGSAKNPPLNFTEGWNYSEKNGKKASWMSAYKDYRNMAFGNGKLYVLDITNSKIIAINAQTGAYLYDVNMTGVSGGTMPVMDVAFVDGKLLATNLTTTASGDPLKVYVWDTDKTAPRVLLQTTNIGSMDRIGDAIEVSGNLTTGEIAFLGQQKRSYSTSTGTTATGNCNTIITYDIKNGVVSTTPQKGDIDGTIIGLSPRAIPFGNNYFVVGQNYHPSICNAAGELSTTVNKAAFQTIQGNDFVPFSFKGTQYAFATDYATYTDVSTGSLLGGHALLLDASAGWTEAEASGRYPSAGLGSTTRNTTMSSSICVAVNGSSGVEMWVLVHSQGIAYYKHGTVPTYVITDTPILSASAASLAFDCVAYTETTKTVTISGANLEGDINLALSGANADLFEISQTTIDKATGSAEIKVTYAPTEAGTHTATLTATSANASAATVTLTGKAAPKTFLDDNIVLTEVWNYSQIKNNLASASWFSTASPRSRDIAYANGKLYVLNGTAWNTTPVITILNAYTGAKQGTLSIEGIASGLNVTASIRALGGKILVSNDARTSDALKVYIWDTDAAAPRVLLEDATHGGIAAGTIMSVSGNLTNGKLIFSDGSKLLIYTITNGTASTSGTTIQLTNASGAAYSVGTQKGSVDVQLMSDGTYWVTGKDVPPAHFDATGKLIESVASSLVQQGGNSTRLFDFGSKKYMASVTYLNKTSTTLAEGAMALLNITNGIGEASANIYPEAGLGTTRNTDFATAVEVNVRDSKIVDAWVLVEYQGIAYYTYNGEKESAVDEVEVAEPMRVLYAGNTIRVLGVEAQRISVYSLSGAMVADAQAENELNTSLLVNGVYIVKVTDVNGSTKTLKIVKR